MRLATMPHVTPSGDKADSVAARLQADMDERGFGVRTLARELVGAGATKEKIDNKRKSVRGWLDGVLPNDESAEELARALQKPASRYKTNRKAKAVRKDKVVLLGQKVEWLVEQLEGMRGRPRQPIEVLEDAVTQLRTHPEQVAELAPLLRGVETELRAVAQSTDRLADQVAALLDDQRGAGSL